MELDLLFYPVEGPSVRANIGLLDAGYDEFMLEGVGGLTDLTNLGFRSTPAVTDRISGNYEWPIGPRRRIFGYRSWTL